MGWSLDVVTSRGQLKALCRRFLVGERGASLPLLAVLTIPIVGIIGLTIDSGRGYLVKARMGDALDAAMLAAAHVKDENKIDDEIRKYFDANFPPGYMGATVTLTAADVDQVAGTIDVSASANMGTTFMRLFGKESVQVGTGTQVTRETVSMDVVLSMDMSGSMSNSDGSGSTRIIAARTAALTLVDVLYGNKTGSDLLTIGLVPWNGAVNIWQDGTSFTGTSPSTVSSFTNPWEDESQTTLYYPNNTPVPLLNNPDNTWNGCVFARYRSGFDEDDGDGTVGVADHLLGPLTTTDGTDWLGWQANWVDPADPGEECDDGCPEYTDCLTHGITRLTDQRTAIENAINALTSPRGVTNIAQGLAWAWRVVSPGEPFADADPFPTGLHERAIVLLTDGEQYGGTNDGYDAAFGTGAAAGANGMNDRLLAVAESIKDSGIKIYVIQFYFSNGPLQTLLKQVASKPKAPYYHFAPDGDALNEAFEEIADDLSALRISR